MRSLVCWVYLNLKYRLRPLPTDPVHLEKIAIDLNVPLAFTYKWHGLDVALAQERIHECLKSFQWRASAPFSCRVGAVQQRVFHQPEQELTTLPILRYSSDHRKGGLKILYPSR